MVGARMCPGTRLGAWASVSLQRWDLGQVTELSRLRFWTYTMGLMVEGPESGAVVLIAALLV